jgi:RNA polymerase sigma-70 factor (ECF subfamily)
MAVTAVSPDFAQQAEAFQRELLVHCYQMLGSVQDAEDLVQETLLRAWRAADRFDERRASLRTWLHRIATNACLNALASRQRRPQTVELAGPHADAEPTLVRRAVAAGLQPFPDALLGGDPAGVLAHRQQLRLALMAARQVLPPRQRAIVILRDVLDFSAAEVAVMLETTPTAVNSGLQRARARLREVAIQDDQIAEPTDAVARALVDQYVAAFERADIATLQHLLTEDVRIGIPPDHGPLVGREAYGRVIAESFALLGTAWRLLATAANSQPALAVYVRGADGAYHAHSIQVLTVTGAGIRRNVVFLNPELFALFRLTPALSGTA